jgi:N-acetyl-gamma-glutamyl-phosphate reductase/acetylglutamate kinase
VPISILIIDVGGPEQFTMILLDRVVHELEKDGSIDGAYLPVGPSVPPHRLAQATAGVAGVRSFSTFASRGEFKMHKKVPSGTRGYATAVDSSTSTEPNKVALIGARGYTGQALVSLLNSHPHLSLTHVSSRQFAGRPLDKHKVTYSDLKVDDVEKMEKEGEVDAWIMVLPNGVCKPFVDAVDRGARSRNGKGGVIVDLSADYRFENDWTYGLPGEKSV